MCRHVCTGVGGTTNVTSALLEILREGMSKSVLYDKVNALVNANQVMEWNFMSQKHLYVLHSSHNLQWLPKAATQLLEQ